MALVNAGTVKVHPTILQTTANFASPQHFNGSTVTAVTITFASDLMAETITEIDSTINVIGSIATPIIYGKLLTNGTVLSVIYERDFPTDTYDGTNSETFAADLEDKLTALANGAAAGATVAVMVL